MGNPWTAGDAAKAQASADALHVLSGSVSDIVQQLKAIHLNTSTVWAGSAAEAAEVKWQAFLGQMGEANTGFGRFGDTMSTSSHDIAAATSRAQIWLGISAGTAVLAAVATVVTAGVSEGAEVIAATVAEEAVGGLFENLAAKLAIGFGDALVQTLIRAGGAIAFNAIIPAAATGAGHLATGTGWKLSDLDSILLGATTGLVIGEAATFVQLGAKLTSPGASFLIGAGSQALNGGVTTALTQAALNPGSHVDWKLVGFNTGVGVVVGGVAAVGAGMIIERMTPAPGGLNVTESAMAPEIELPAVGGGAGPGEHVTAEVIPNPGGEPTIIARNPNNAPFITPESVASLGTSELTSLATGEARLAAAGNAALDSAVSDAISTQVGESSQVLSLIPEALMTPSNSVARETIEAEGLQLRAELRDYAATSEVEAERLAAAAQTPQVGGADAIAAVAEADKAAELDAIHAEAERYERTLRWVQAQTALSATPPGQSPDITQLSSAASPALTSELQSVQAAASLTSSPAPSSDPASWSGAPTVETGSTSFVTAPSTTYVTAPDGSTGSNPATVSAGSGSAGQASNGAAGPAHAPSVLGNYTPSQTVATSPTPASSNVLGSPAPSVAPPSGLDPADNAATIAAARSAAINRIVAQSAWGVVIGGGSGGLMGGVVNPQVEPSLTTSPYESPTTSTTEGESTEGPASAPPSSLAGVG